MGERFDPCAYPLPPMPPSSLGGESSFTYFIRDERGDEWAADYILGRWVRVRWHTINVCGGGLGMSVRDSDEYWLALDGEQGGA